MHKQMPFDMGQNCTCQVFSSTITCSHYGKKSS